ncbi:gas vesicle structural protein GvpA [Streptomyces sp. 71268]|uniref:gas vesicle protein GvpJ n=1 Tax=Streptomyces sp. 71268 TaxID=3002640 RepID=UPI0023F911E2|nr:gas vesicle protein GvpJ [Streptomyces sp. 71268]WEV23940.1 gas vesicle structural protein GvpA [Streptomyces sp. 71268]
MSVMAQSPTAAPSQGGNSGTLYDVLELILDRGLVIDAFVRVSLVGIEILKVDVRVVVASVDTYLRFAEACNRLDLESGRKAPTQLTDIVGEATESGAKGKSKGALSGAVEAVGQTLGRGRKGDDEPESADGDGKKTTSRRSTARGE